MRSYLVVGNQTLAGPELTAAIAERIRSGAPTQFHVVVPATPIQEGFTWDEDKAYNAARERLDAMLAASGRDGCRGIRRGRPRGPDRGVADALRGHPADEVILSTLPSGISRWLGQDVPIATAGSVLVPVTWSRPRTNPVNAAQLTYGRGPRATDALRARPNRLQCSA